MQGGAEDTHKSRKKLGINHRAPQTNHAHRVVDAKSRRHCRIVSDACDVQHATRGRCEMRSRA